MLIGLGTARILTGRAQGWHSISWVADHKCPWAGILSWGCLGALGHSTRDLGSRLPGKRWQFLESFILGCWSMSPLCLHLPWKGSTHKPWLHVCPGQGRELAAQDWARRSPVQDDSGLDIICIKTRNHQRKAWWNKLMLCLSRWGNLFLHFGTLSVQNCQNKEEKACCWEEEAFKLGKNSSCGTGSFPSALDGRVVSAWCFQRAIKVLSCQSTEGQKAPRPLVLSLSDDLNVSNKVSFFWIRNKVSQILYSSEQIPICLSKVHLLSLRAVSFFHRSLKYIVWIFSGFRMKS